MSKICSDCNAENVDEAKFCRKCGKDSFNTEDNSNIEIMISTTSEKSEEKKSGIQMKTSTNRSTNNDDGNFFFDYKNEPKFLFLVSFWLSFFATLILLEQQGII